ncbi:MAG: putative metal-dependent hydrolase [Gemmatimonadota bacterium]|nr:putative metal-dependent hydrolase [Gemmatimonadota bacterium]
MSLDALDPAELESRRYPTGRFEPLPGPLSMQERGGKIDRIAGTPERLRAAVAGLDDDRLDTPYRPEGWSVRQVIHHVADSHINAYVRFKLAVTEDHPTIRTYEESLWGELHDARTADVEVSLALLEALHVRWTAWLGTLGPDDWSRTLDHPEYGTFTLDDLLAMYAWHGGHHAAQIEGLRERNGW